jgi:hypothetical protein
VVTVPPAGNGLPPPENYGAWAAALVLSVVRREEEIRMFVHAGSRALWPVIVFLPWFLLGFAYLLESLLRRRPRR